MYKIEKNYNRLTNSYSTFFLNPKEANELKGKLKKEKYLISERCCKGSAQ